MNFNKSLADYVREAEDVIRSYLPEESGEAAHLLEAMNYSMTAGGKRLRPVMMRMSYEMFGGREEIIFPFMAAMEMIHTHSLIHDDLPAMDNDEYRRGKKTTHIVYGEAAAILAGDGLLNLAYETAAGAVASIADPLLLMKGAKALKILAEKTGINGMIGGQSVDVEMDGRPLNAKQIDFIYCKKTGALLEASLMTGAALAGADDEQLLLMEQIGRKIGVAFQIRDDILDETGDEKELGKPLHSDARNQKTTYVTLNGLDQADRDVHALTKEALALFDAIGTEHPVFRDLLISLTQRRK